MSILTDYPWWFSIFCVLAGAGYALLLYYRERNESFRPLARWLLATARFVAVSVLAFLLLSPMVRTLRTTREKPLIVMAMDNSSSIVVSEDSAALTQSWEALARELEGEFDLRPFLFGDQVTTGAQPKYGDKYTDPSLLFEEIRTRFVNRNLGAIVLATDGLYNRGSNPAFDPAIAEWPIVGIALGDTSRQTDVRVSRLFYNRITYLGNDFPVEAVIQASGFEGAQLMLRVSQDGRAIRQVPVKVSSAEFSTTIPLVFTAEKVGLSSLSFSLGVMSGETNTANNSQKATIEVLDARQKILIYSAAPHPDLGAIRQAIEGNQNYEVELRTVPEPLNDIDGFNLLILHGLPTTKYPLRELLQSIATRGFPVLHIISQSTDLRMFNTIGAGVDFINLRNSWNDAQGASSGTFSLFTLPEGWQELIKDLPPLKVPFADMRPSRASSNLLTQKIGTVTTGYPLILFSQENGRRTGVILGEGIWRWRLQNYLLRSSHSAFDELINKMVQFLSVRSDRSRFRVEAEYEYPENEPVVIKAELYNEAFELVNEPDARLIIEDSSGKAYPFAFTRRGNAYSLNAGMLGPGRYTFAASTQLGKDSYERKGSFRVTPVLVEQQTTRADHSSLFLMASESEGQVFYRDQMQEAASWLKEKENIRTVVYEKKSFAELIHLKWLFYCILALLTIEWFFRRWLGSY